MCGNAGLTGCGRLSKARTKANIAYCDISEGNRVTLRGPWALKQDRRRTLSCAWPHIWPVYMTAVHPNVSQIRASATVEIAQAGSTPGRQGRWVSTEPSHRHGSMPEFTSACVGVAQTHVQNEAPLRGPTGSIKAPNGVLSSQRIAWSGIRVTGDAHQQRT